MLVNGALNLLLLFFVTVALKKRPYVAAALFALVKATLSFFLSKDLVAQMQLSTTGRIGIAVIVGCICGVIAMAFMYFFTRMSRPRNPTEESVPLYSVGSSEKMTFRWESIPLVGLLLVLLFL
jgi:hypothetical protein